MKLTLLVVSFIHVNLYIVNDYSNMRKIKECNINCKITGNEFVDEYINNARSI